jgi:hypothetical protein
MIVRSLRSLSLDWDFPYPQMIYKVNLEAVETNHLFILVMAYQGEPTMTSTTSRVQAA